MIRSICFLFSIRYRMRGEWKKSNRTKSDRCFGITINRIFSIIFFFLATHVDLNCAETHGAYRVKIFDWFINYCFFFSPMCLTCLSFTKRTENKYQQMCVYIYRSCTDCIMDETNSTRSARVTRPPIYSCAESANMKPFNLTNSINR